MTSTELAVALEREFAILSLLTAELKQAKQGTPEQQKPVWSPDLTELSEQEEKLSELQDRITLSQNKMKILLTRMDVL
ncbi:hypothetical protein CIG19_17750 [Enterobacterales bacterium CwR94]|nr:hypothetical protein CIG19_17750 [Enterobacterales bacterium CwR94]